MVHSRIKPRVSSPLSFDVRHGKKRLLLLRDISVQIWQKYYVPHNVIENDPDTNTTKIKANEKSSTKL